MTAVAFDKSFDQIIDPASEPERIATGYQFTEGPVWHSRNHTLTFSDVRGGVMYQWTESGGPKVFRDPSGGANGNTYDRRGGLVTCEHGGRRVSRTDESGAVTTLVDNFEGKRLSSPNDVVTASNGDVLFTDPPYGLRQPDGAIVGQEIPFNGVFRLSAATGRLSVLVDDFERPNGLVLTPDESLLYIADTTQQHVRVFDVRPDGSLGNGRMFAEKIQGDTGGTMGTGGPDGMKLDSRGNLYVAANQVLGVWVFNPAGDLLGQIPLPEPPANLAFGGDGWSTLFGTSRTSVYRVQMKAAGQPVAID
jgi:sugar lactone lactonase YvrE